MKTLRSILTSVALILMLSATAGHAQFARFDQTTDTIALAGNTALGTTATYEAVVLLSSPWDEGTIFFEQVAGTEHKQLTLATGAVRGFGFSPGVNLTSFAPPATVSTNVFHHIAFVRDGTEERVYLDGVRTGTRVVAAGSIGNAAQGAHPAAIGGSAFDNAQNSAVPAMLGLMDSVRISNVARYSGASFTPPTGDMTSDANTLLLFNFNPAEVTGNTIADLSGNGHTGTFASGFVGATTPTIVASLATPVYTFTLSDGLLNGRDNWTNHPANNANVQVVGGRIIGGGAGVSRAVRVNNASFSLAPFAATQTSAVFQVEMTMPASVPTNNKGVAAGLRTNSADPVQSAFELGIFFNTGLPAYFNLNLPVVGNVEAPVPAGVVAGDNLEVQLRIDFTANGGDGAGSVYFRNLTQGATGFSAVPGLQNLNLHRQGLSAANRDPATWNTMSVRVDSNINNTLDNITVIPALAPAFFTESFGAPTITADLVPGTGFVYGAPAGRAQNTSAARHYVKTSSTSYNTTDFVSEVTMNVANSSGPNVAFFGFGSGAEDAGFFNEPHTSVYLRLFPSDFGSGATTLSVSNAPGNRTDTTISTSPHPGSGTHRARIAKVGNVITFSVDANYAGGAFTADFAASKNLVTDLPFLNSTNSRLFFGVEGANTTFDDFDLRPPVDIAVTGIPDGGSQGFGIVTLGTSGTPVTFTITNTGSLIDLTGLAITADGANPGDFAVSAVGSSSVAKNGGTTTFNVTFTPSASGARSAVIHIASNVPGAKNPYDITLNGTGNARPVVTPPPSPIIVEATSDSGAVVLAADFNTTASDLEDGARPLTFTPAGGSTFPLGDTTVNASATDSNGATGTASFIVRVRDTTVPAIGGTFTPLTLTTGTGGTAALPDYTSQATTSDNVGVTSVTQSPAPGPVSVGTTHVTLTAHDAAGNTASTSFDVTVNDGTPPTIGGTFTPLTLTTGAGGTATLPGYTGQVTTSDNVGVTSVTQSPASGPVSAGTTHVTLTALDAAGNTATTAFDVTVNDGTAPTIGGTFTPLTLTTGAGGTATLPNYTGQATTSDNVGVTSVTQSPAPAGNVSVGTTHVTLTAHDAAGNTTSTSFDVTVNDGTPPTIGGTFTPLTLTTGAGGTATLPDYTGQATTSDNVGVTSVTQSPASGPVSAGTTHVTLTALDAAGNTATTAFDVTVNDGTPPTITVTGANPATAFQGATYTDAGATAVDAVDGARTVTSSGSVNINVPGSYTITYTATDTHNNTATATRTVNVVTAPAGTVLAIDPNITGTDVFTAVSQPDGKIIIGGAFTQVSGVTRNNIARLKADGTLDTGFNPNADGSVQAVALQSDGKIVIGGAFNNVGGVSRGRIARLNADGTLDTGFDPKTAGGSFVSCLLVQPDGKIVLGGSFTSLKPNGAATATTRNRIARVNANGTLDTAFNPNLNAQVNAIVRQEDGAIVFGGTFTLVGSVTRNGIARLNNDASGTLDATYNPNAGSVPQVNSLCLQSDGKVLAGGEFLTLGGLSRFRLGRLNSSGSGDATFVLPGAGVNSAVQSIALATDGQLIIGGAFTSITGTTRNRVARLTSTGALDAGFNPNAGGAVSGVAQLADGRIIIGGAFTTIGGITRNHLALLANDAVTDALTVPNSNRIQWLRGGAAPEVGPVTFELSTDGGSTFTSLGNGARIVGGWELTGLSLPVSGQIRARGRTMGGIQNGSSGLIEAVSAFALPEIVVEQPLGADVVSGATKSFGSVQVGSSATLTFTVKNIGTADLTGLGITVGGTDAALFTITANPTAPVAGGTDTTFTVQFAPLSAGGKTAVIHIANNDGNENPFDIIFTGNGPEIDVQEPAGVANRIPDGGERSFGSIPTGTTVSRTFTIANIGNANLTGLGITKDGADAGLFTITANPTAPVIGGSSTTFTVQFAPLTSGPKTAAIHIASNDFNENPYDITLTGQANSPIETWRQQFFGSTANTGNGADTNDFDLDGLSNLVEFAFGLDPLHDSAGQLPQPQVISGNLVLTFTQPAAVTGITYHGEFSATMQPDDWHPIPDTGTGSQHTFSVPMVPSRTFLRVNVTSQP